jgi:transcriptional regulator with XRE-family HTH domain
MEAKHIVGWNVRRIRTAKKITIDELADISEIDPSYIARIERGVVNTSIGKLEQISRALSVKLVDLVVEPPAGAKAPQPMKAGRRPKRY